jgi:serine/threonine-protein kinase
MDRDPFDLVGDVLDGQFRVDAFAGEGDLSVVYRGHHLGVEATVAIKCLNLPATLDSTYGKPLVDGFKDASRIHYRLARGNLNIAQTIASGSTVAPRTGAVVPYLVREWFEGESLASDLRTRREKKMTGRSVNETLALLEAAYDGVSYAHQQGEVHLSLNPSNLFLATKVEGGASLKVLDFGVASAMNDIGHGKPDAPVPPMSRRGLRVLFPAYAAPEQLDQAVGPQGPWTDVYAMALITLEVLSDRVVMSEPDPGTLIEHALDDRRRPNPQAHGLKLPRNLELVLTRAVLRAPDRRPKNAAELWRDMKSAVRPALSRPQVAVAAVGVATGMGDSSGLGPSTLVPTAGAPAPANVPVTGNQIPVILPASPAAAAPASMAVPLPAGETSTSTGTATGTARGVPAIAPSTPSITPVSTPALTPAPAPVPPSTPAIVPQAPAGSAPSAPWSSPVSSQPTTAPRVRSATLMGLSAPAVVVGAVGNRLKLPSTPSVETQPMSFAPLSQSDPFSVEPVTIANRPAAPIPGFPGTPSPPAAAVAPEPSQVPGVAAQPPDIAALPGGSSSASPDQGGAWAPTGQPDTAPAAMDSAYYPTDSVPSPPKLVQVPKTALLAAATIVALSGLISILAAIKSCSKTNAPVAAASASAAASSAASASASASAQGSASAAPSAAAAPTEPTAELLAPPSAPAAPEATTPFSVKVARNALNATGREVAKCRRTKLWGIGEASVTFDNDGTVSHVVVGSPFRGTPSGECVTGVLGGVQVAPFAGKPATINYKFFIPIK